MFARPLFCPWIELGSCWFAISKVLDEEDMMALCREHGPAYCHHKMHVPYLEYLPWLGHVKWDDGHDVPIWHHSETAQPSHNSFDVSASKLNPLCIDMLQS
jgi:hypothetical protein